MFKERSDRSVQSGAGRTMYCSKKKVVIGVILLVTFFVWFSGFTNSNYDLQLEENSRANGAKAEKPRATAVALPIKITHPTTVKPSSSTVSPRIFQMITDIIKADTAGPYPTGSLENITCKPTVPGAIEDILCMKPPAFDKNYKNPCWRNPEGRLRCLPYFQVIGNDKCGSTDLFDRIAMHPDVFKNKGTLQKETMWWSWRRYGHWLKVNVKIETFEQYLNYFENSAKAIEAAGDSKGFHSRITGDGTPMDFWDESGWPSIPQNDGLKEPKYITPHLIKHLNPDVKLLLILRDPTERLFSDYFFLGLGGATTKAFHDNVMRSLNNLHACTRTASLRSCLYNRKLHVKSGARIHLGFYSVFLKDWLSVFPGKILILRTEDYSRNTESTMEGIFKYLNLSSLPDSKLEEIGNSSRKHVTKKKQTAGKMMPQTKAILKELYKTFNFQLAEMLNDERYLWSDVL